MWACVKGACVPATTAPQPRAPVCLWLQSGLACHLRGGQACSWCGRRWTRWACLCAPLSAPPLHALPEAPGLPSGTAPDSPSPSPPAPPHAPARQVQNSLEGWAAGSSIPGPAKNVQKPFLQPYYHRQDCGAATVHADGSETRPQCQEHCLPCTPGAAGLRSCPAACPPSRLATDAPLIRGLHPSHAVRADGVARSAAGSAQCRMSNLTSDTAQPERAKGWRWRGCWSAPTTCQRLVRRAMQLPIE